MSNSEEQRDKPLLLLFCSKTALRLMYQILDLLVSVTSTKGLMDKPVSAQKVKGREFLCTWTAMVA